MLETRLVLYAPPSILRSNQNIGNFDKKKQSHGQNDFSTFGFFPCLLWWPLLICTDPHRSEVLTNTCQGGRLLN